MAYLAYSAPNSKTWSEFKARNRTKNWSMIDIDHVELKSKHGQQWNIKTNQSSWFMTFWSNQRIY